MGLPETSKIVLLISHSEFKDYDMMIRAISDLNKGTLDGELIFICLGRTEAERSLEQGKLIFPGLIRDEEKMALFYQAADVYIHGSKGEVFGNTIIEAMACGKPVVASAIGGIPEIIDHGNDGFLVFDRDIKNMTEFIQLLLEDDELRRRMGNIGSKKVLDKYTIQRQAHEFLNWFEEILESKRTNS